MDKRGLSAIVATVLIILVTIAGVSIVWFGIVPMIRNGVGGSNIDPFLSLEIIQGRYSVWDSGNRLATVQIKRGSDKSDLAGLDLIFFLGGNSVTHFVPSVPSVNTVGVYYVNLSSYSGGLSSVSVAPVFRDGKRGNVLSLLEVGDFLSTDVLDLIGSGDIPAGSFEEPNGGTGSGTPESCVEDWNCTGFGACVDGIESQSCSDLNLCGTFDDLPVLVRDCVCVEDWSCSGFGECVDGIESQRDRKSVV